MLTPCCPKVTIFKDLSFQMNNSFPFVLPPVLFLLFKQRGQSYKRNGSRKKLKEPVVPRQLAYLLIEYILKHWSFSVYTLLFSQLVFLRLIFFF